MNAKNEHDEASQGQTERDPRAAPPDRTSPGERQAEPDYEASSAREAAARRT